MKTSFTPVEDARMTSTEDDMTVTPPQAVTVKEDT